MIMKEIDLDILMHLHILSSPEHKKVIFEMLSVYTDVHLTSTQMDELYLYLVFKILSVVGQCPVHMNILAPKNRGPSYALKKQFSQKWL
jgi:hypothetical protein